MNHAAVALAALAIATGCAQNVNVKVPGAHTKVVVNGEDLGAVPPGGKTIEVKPGMAPLTYVVEDGTAPPRIGSVARTEPIWWIVGVAAAGAVCCAPSLACAGFCIANPGVIVAPSIVAVTGDVGALTSALVAPSWFTLPLVTGCGALGLAPLGAALVAETVPPEVTLGPPSRTGATGAEPHAMAH